MEQPIYEILMLEKPIQMNKVGYPDYGSMEPVGFYYEKEVAIQAVKENWADINDFGTFAAALIVKKEPGLYPYCPEREYFIWDKPSNQYVDAELPEGMEYFNIT